MIYANGSQTAPIFYYPELFILKRFLKNGQYKVIEDKGSIYTKLHIW